MLVLLDRRIAPRWITSHHKYHKQMSSLFSGLWKILNEIAGIGMLVDMQKRKEKNQMVVVMFIFNPPTNKHPNDEETKLEHLDKEDSSSRCPLRSDLGCAEPAWL